MDLTEHFKKANAFALQVFGRDQKLVHISMIEKDKIFCAKFSIDNCWYRVKVIRAPLATDDKIFVDFIDNGNEENIPIDHLREIPDEFVEYKYLPPQV